MRNRNEVHPSDDLLFKTILKISSRNFRHRLKLSSFFGYAILDISEKKSCCIAGTNTCHRKRISELNLC